MLTNGVCFVPSCVDDEDEDEDNDDDFESSCLYHNKSNRIAK